MSFIQKIKRIFQNDDVLLYTAIGDDNCMRIVGKLNDAGIPYKSRAHGTHAGTGKRSLGFDTKLSQYDIYVKKDDEHKARVAIEKN